MDAVDLFSQGIPEQLLDIKMRQYPHANKRQVDFNRVEILMCYGLFYILDPHRYGGRNIHLAPDALHVLARFFKRSASSLTSKMLNMDGSRAHSGKDEVRVFAQLAAAPDVYIALYRAIIRTARQLSIDENYTILRASLLQQSIAHDIGAEHYFGMIIQPRLLLPVQARQPAVHYLRYHQHNVFRG